MVAGAESGDKIILDAGTLATTTAANWNTSVNYIAVVSGFITAGTGASGLNAEGSVAVFVTGGDTYFSVNNGGTTATFQQFIVKGVDLVKTTKVGNVAFNTTNFGFTLAQENTTDNTGLIVTLS